MPIYSTDRIWPEAQQVRASCRSGLYRLAKTAVLFALRFRVLPQAAALKALLRITFDARWPAVEAVDFAEEIRPGGATPARFGLRQTR